ncbi:GFA family protein [Porticoccaceae bacterium LTM1]|nr:GFA family protein [Porticoccaceae bacterium LTM1]
MNPKERKATCNCGQLTAVVSGQPVRIAVCHCTACQIRTGSAFGVQARFDKSDVSISGHSNQYSRVADSGNRIRYDFCPDCGATLFYQFDSIPNVVSIPVGAFADQDFPPPTISIYEERQHPWVKIEGDIEHMN